MADDKKPDDKTPDWSDIIWRDPTDKWTPDWTDMRAVRTWLTITANSLETAAKVLEGGVLMLRAMAGTVRKAMPPWPQAPSDPPPPKRE